LIPIKSRSMNMFGVTVYKPRRTLLSNHHPEYYSNLHWYSRNTCLYSLFTGFKSCLVFVCYYRRTAITRVVLEARHLMQLPHRRHPSAMASIALGKWTNFRAKHFRRPFSYSTSFTGHTTSFLKSKSKVSRTVLDWEGQGWVVSL